MSTPTLLSLLEQTARNPREAVRSLKAMALTPEIAWLAFAAVLAVEIFFIHLLSTLAGPAEPAPGALAPGLVESPLLLGLVQGSVVLLMTLSVHWVGRALGGTGRLEVSVAAVALLVFTMMVLQVVELVIVVIVPGLVGGVLLFHIAVFFWLLTMFITEIHGFKRPPLVLVGIILSMFAIAFVLSLVLALIGITLPGAPTNV